MVSEIEALASRMLNVQELALASHLALILGNNEMDAEGFLEEILPKYWEKLGDGEVTLQPGAIYRPLYYLHGDGYCIDFREVTRNFIKLAADHLEGCLACLTRNPPKGKNSNQPFGKLLKTLRQEGVLTEKLAEVLESFNRVANIPSKHFSSFKELPSRLEERTFSVSEAALVFVMMRGLSIRLFGLLISRGVSLPSLWRDYDSRWLSWNQTIYDARRKGLIARHFALSSRRNLPFFKT